MTADWYRTYERYLEWMHIPEVAEVVKRSLVAYDDGGKRRFDDSYGAWLDTSKDPKGETALQAVSYIIDAVEAAWADDAPTSPENRGQVRIEFNRLRDRATAREIFEKTKSQVDPALSAQMRERFVSGADVLELPEPGWVINDVIPAGSLVFTYGPPKSGKSLIVMDQTLSYVTGQPWAVSEDRQFGQGYKPWCYPHGGDALYVYAEGVGGLPRRAEAWLNHHGQHLDPDTHGPQDETQGNIEWFPRALNLRDPGEVSAFLDNAEMICPTLVVIDTLARCALGADENSTKDMGEIVASLDRIRDILGCTVHVVHHSGKDASRGLRGSSALHGAADVIYEVTRSGRNVTWKCTDMKDGEEPRPMGFTLTPVERSVVLEVGGKTSQENWLTIVRGVIRNVKAYEESTGEPPSRTQVLESNTVKARHAAKRAALEYARDMGALKETSGPRGAIRYSFVADLDNTT